MNEWRCRGEAERVGREAEEDGRRNAASVSMRDKSEAEAAGGVGGWELLPQAPQRVLSGGVGWRGREGRGGREQECVGGV